MQSKRVISLINIVYYPQVLNITECLKTVFNFKCFLIQTFNCILLLFFSQLCKYQIHDIFFFPPISLSG